MILTDELCDKLCAAAREKAKKWESISVKWITQGIPSLRRSTGSQYHSGTREGL